MKEEASDSETIIRTAREMLLYKYGINHTTLQILPFSAGEMEHCNHCNGNNYFLFTFRGQGKTIFCFSFSSVVT